MNFINLFSDKSMSERPVGVQSDPQAVTLLANLTVNQVLENITLASALSHPSVESQHVGHNTTPHSVASYGGQTVTHHSYGGQNMSGQQQNIFLVRGESPVPAHPWHSQVKS